MNSHGDDIDLPTRSCLAEASSLMITAARHMSAVEHTIVDLFWAAVQEADEASGRRRARLARGPIAERYGDDALHPVMKSGFYLQQVPQ